MHLGIDRLELGLGDRAIEADDVHIDADAAELVEAALHLFHAASICGNGSITYEAIRFG